MPFFSIIIPTYNRAHIITKAIESVLSQSFQDFEIIIVDDGSEDKTIEFLQSYLSEKVHCVLQKNAGVCSARNHGARLAKGRYLIFLDSDDWLSENCLMLYWQALEKGHFKLVLGVSYFYSAAHEKVRETKPADRGEHYGQGLSGSFAMARTVFEALGGFDERLTFAENSDLFLRLRLEQHIQKQEVVITNVAGVCISEEESNVRRKRYSLKKYQSVIYFLEKHRDFFDRSAKDFINFQRVLAFSALHNGLYREARTALCSIIIRYPFSFKSYFQFLLFLMPMVARKYYGADGG